MYIFPCLFGREELVTKGCYVHIVIIYDAKVYTLFLLPAQLPAMSGDSKFLFSFFVEPKSLSQFYVIVKL